MKKGTKVLLMIGCAVLLVGTSIAGTMAYLTSKTAEVKNTFTVGKVEITLDEAKVNAEGKPMDGDANDVNNGSVVELDKATRQQKNEYHLLPDRTYTKDPTIHVAPNSADCWVFAMVQNDITDIEIEPEELSKKKIQTQIITENKWNKLDGVTKPDSVDSPAWANSTVYCKKVSTNTMAVDLPLFSSFTIDPNVTDLTGHDSNVITITGYAIQKSDSFDFDSSISWTSDDIDNAKLAWNAVKDVATTP